MLLATAWGVATPAPRDPMLRLQAGLAREGADAAALRRLVAENFDLARMAQDMLAGLPGAEPRHARRLVALLERRMLRILQRHPALPTSVTWLEERPVGAGDTLVMSRVPAAGGEASLVIGWRVAERGDGHRIVDLWRDGVSVARLQRAELAALARERGLDAALSAWEAALE